MRKILVNAFSAQMLNINNRRINVHFKEIKAADIPQDVESAIGHADTAAVLSDLLKFDIPANRTNVFLDYDTVLYLAQLQGGRLPEGATTLPDGFSFKFFKVFIPRIYTWMPEDGGQPGGMEVVAPDEEAPKGKYWLRIDEN